MALHDSDPERRNVIVTAMAFIAYFYAGGYFPATTVRLQVINVEFSKPEVLGYIIWSIYIWFIYRYWVTHRGLFKKAFSAELQEWRNQLYITNYVNQYFGQELKKDSSTHEYHAAGMAWRGWRVTITCSYANVRRDADGNITATSSLANEEQKHPTQYIPLKGLKGWVLALRASIECIFKRPGFSSYIFPYLLVILSFVGVAKKHVF